MTRRWLLGRTTGFSLRKWNILQWGGQRRRRMKTWQYFLRIANGMGQTIVQKSESSAMRRTKHTAGCQWGRGGGSGDGLE